MDFLWKKMPELLGFRDIETPGFYLPYFSAIVFGCLLVFFIMVFFLRRRAIGHLLTGDASRIQGIDLLLIFLFGFPFLYLKSGFGGSGTSRYLVPLFTALPIILGFSFQSLRGFRKFLLVLFLGCLLISNLYGIQDHLFLIHPEKVSGLLGDPEKRPTLVSIPEGPGDKPNLCQRLYDRPAADL